MAKNEENVVNLSKGDQKEDLSVWTWKLSQPTTYNGEEITELKFNFNKLTGMDAIEVENELMRTGKLAIYGQASNINYILRMAARACEKPIGIDLFDIVGITDFHVLRTHTQLFLTNTP